MRLRLLKTKRSESLMIPPNNLTEEEFVYAVNRVIALVAPSFVFSYYDFDDISQHCWVEVLKALPKYDGIRPLENFVFTHCRNRLINLWRDELRRNEPPCRECYEAHSTGISPAQLSHGDGDYCKKFKAWLKRNSTKASLAEPQDIAYANEDNKAIRDKKNIAAEVEFTELLRRIDAELPAELRSTYQRMLAEEKVSTRQRARVAAAIEAILLGAKHDEV